MYARFKLRAFVKQKRNNLREGGRRRFVFVLGLNLMDNISVFIKNSRCKDWGANKALINEASCDFVCNIPRPEVDADMIWTWPSFSFAHGTCGSCGQVALGFA